jgi:hypothetical protein
MGTNYYRIPSEEEVAQRKILLEKRIAEMETTPLAISHSFGVETENSWDRQTPWDEFMKGMNVHLGKRSGGWKFSWNFHKNKYYSNKKELVDFLNSGRVIDEYGVEISSGAFLEMALNWCTDGWDVQTYYASHPGSFSFITPAHYDRYVDGLCVSASTDFS